MKDLLTGWLLYTAILLFLASIRAEQAAALLPEAWGRE